MTALFTLACVYVYASFMYTKAWCPINLPRPLSQWMDNAKLKEVKRLQWNLNQNSYIFIQEIAHENVVWKMSSILSRPQCINSITPPKISNCSNSVIHCPGHPGGSLWLEELMQGRFGFRRISSILIISSAIVFRVSVFSSNSFL